MCIESAPTLTSLSLCRLCCEPPGDPGQPARPVQAPGLPAGYAGVGLPQTDHQGHRPGAQGQQLHPGQFSLLTVSAATQTENGARTPAQFDQDLGAAICCRVFTYRPHASVFTSDISARSAARPRSQREPTTGLPGQLSSAGVTQVTDHQLQLRRMRSADVRAVPAGSAATPPPDNLHKPASSRCFYTHFSIPKPSHPPLT